MKIVVLARRLSPERSVFLPTGTMMTETLWALDHRAGLTDLYFDLEMGGTDEASFDAPVPEAHKKVSHEALDLDQVQRGRKGDSPSMFGPGVLESCWMADMISLALYGTCGEDGRVQAAFGLMEVPYTGASYLGSAIAMDKDLTKRMVADVVSILGWKIATYTVADIDRLVGTAHLPLVVKPVASGSSIGAFIVHTAEELCRSLIEGLALGGRMVLEECIRGREIQAGILEDKALPSIEIIPKQGSYDYANKYQLGAALKVCPAEIILGEEVRMRTAALRVYGTLGLSIYPRADFILMGDGEPQFLGINTLPGMAPTSLLSQEAAAADIDYNKPISYTRL